MDVMHDLDAENIPNTHYNISFGQPSSFDSILRVCIASKPPNYPSFCCNLCLQARAPGSSHFPTFIIFSRDECMKYKATPPSRSVPVPVINARKWYHISISHHHRRPIPRSKCSLISRSPVPASNVLLNPDELVPYAVLLLLVERETPLKRSLVPVS